jgi:HAD superfamily phosphatase (TIGR01668 family)
MGWLDSFVPDEVVPSVTEIDLDALAARGIEGLIIDVDNTLLAYGVLEIDPERLAWARRAVERFRVCLLSNSLRGRRMRWLSELLGVPGLAVWDWNRKPFRGGLRRALVRTGTAPERTAMIGDQLISDMLGGNRVGLYTILVAPIHTREFVVTRYINRRLERMIRKRLAVRGVIVPEPEEARDDT